MNPKVPGAVILGFFVRWIVTLGSGWAVAHGMINTDQVPAFIQDGILALPAVAMLIWSYHDKITVEIRAWLASRQGTPNPVVNSETKSKARDEIAKSAAILLILVLAGSLSACAQISQADATIKANAVKIASICDNDVMPIANSTAADLLAMAFGPVAQAQASAVAACHAVDTVAQSASTVDWLMDQITIMKTKGKVLPKPVAPAPIKQ